MNSLINWFIKYPIWANVLKIVVFAFGIISLMNMRSSFFAELESSRILIQGVYPGASPEEIEKGIIQKIEDNLKGIKGLDRYTSRSRENSGNITIEVFRDQDMDEVLQDVKNAVDMINSFPAGMEPLVVSKVPAVEFAVSFGITGTEDLKSLKNYARAMENDLRGMEGISQIDIYGFPEEEIVAYVDESALRKYNLTFDDISRRIAAANRDISAGKIRTDSEELIVRLEKKEYYAEEFQDIVVRAAPQGKLVRLRDVAKVRNTWDEQPQESYIDGKRAVIVRVSKLINENILDISDAVKAYVQEYNEKHPNIDTYVLDDGTESLRGRINTLLENGSLGAMLVILSLALFLNVRLAFWVALSIPFSFLGMFIVANMLGITINVLSMFGAILVVGILVDDGIVVGEQIYQNYERGMKPYSAALKGTKKVLGSIFFAIITTITVFIPFFFLEGRQGSSMRDLATVVIFALIFSLIEAALILPAHLAHSKAIRGDKRKSKFRAKLERLLMIPRDRWYQSSLKFFLKYKVLGIAIIIAMSMITIGAFRGGVIHTTFFPFIDSDSFEVVLSMPPGTRGHITKDVLDRIEKAAIEVNDELSSEREDAQPVIERLIKHVGRDKSGGFGAPNMGQSHNGILNVVLINGEKRDIRSYDVASMIREKVGPIYSADEVIYGQSSLFGKPVSITMASPNLQELEQAKIEMMNAIRNIPQLGDVTDNDPKGLREVKMTLKPEAYLLGLTNLEVARQIRQGFFGDEVQRIQRGQDEIKVWVRYSDKDRSSLGKFEDMRIKLPDGREYPLSELITYNIKRGETVINHINGMREITVEADVTDTGIEVPPLLSKVENEVLPPILAKYPSIKLLESGQKREIMKTARSSRNALPIALIAVFFLITLSFRSYSQAGVVLLLIPFGFIGAAWGHLVHDMPISIMSAYGIIALIGIIVNDSIVFINTMNDSLEKGVHFNKALFLTGVRRFRPIVLTTFTTILGFLPLLTEGSIQAQFLKPMAASVAYGLLVGSVFLLIFLPLFLSMLNDIKVYSKWLWTGKRPTKNEVEPAVKEVQDLKKLSD